MIKIIARSVFYNWLILFVGIALGFIFNAEWSGKKYVIIEHSINNIFFPANKYNKDVEQYVRFMGSIRLKDAHDYPEDFTILKDEILDEEFYSATIRYTDPKTGKIVEKKEGTRVRWRPWEYYYQDVERTLAK